MACSGGADCTCECPPKGGGQASVLFSHDSMSTAGTSTPRPAARRSPPTSTPKPAALAPPAGTATTYGGGSGAQKWCRCKATCKPTGATEKPNVPEDDASGSPSQISDPDDPGVLSRAGMAGGPRSLLLDLPRRGVSRLHDAFVGSLGQSSVRALLPGPITFDWLGDRPQAGAGFVEPLPIVPFPRGLGSQVNGLPPAPRTLYGKTTRGAGGITILDRPPPATGTGSAPVSAMEGGEPPAAPSGTWVSLGGSARRGIRPPTWTVKRVVAIDDSVRGVASAAPVEPMEEGPVGSPPLWPADGWADAGPPGPSNAPFSAVTPPGGPDVIADGVFGSDMEPTPSQALVPGQAQRPPQWLDPEGGRGAAFMDLLGGAAAQSRGADIFASGSVRSAMGFRGKGGGGGGPRSDAPGATVAAAAAIQRQLDDMFKSGDQVGKADLVAAYGQARLDFDRMKAGKNWGKTFESATARERRRQDKATALAEAAQAQSEKSLAKRWEKREALLRPLSYQGPDSNPFAQLRAFARIEHWKAAVAGIAKAREAKSYITQQRALFLSLRKEKFLPRTPKERADVKRLTARMTTEAYGKYQAATAAYWKAVESGTATPAELKAAKVRMEGADRLHQAIKAGFPEVVKQVERSLREAGAAQKALLKLGRDLERMSKGGIREETREDFKKRIQVAEAELEQRLLNLAASMLALWRLTHPPEEAKDAPKRDKDGNIVRESMIFPPSICASEKLCECGSASTACDCAEGETCDKCEKEWVLPPGANAVKGLGDQLMAPGLLPRNQVQAIGGQIADIIRENIYFAGESTVRSPGDTPAGGIGGHGPSVSPFATPAGVIPYYASPDKSSASLGNTATTTSRSVDSSSYWHEKNGRISQLEVDLAKKMEQVARAESSHTILQLKGSYLQDGVYKALKGLRSEQFALEKQLKDARAAIGTAAPADSARRQTHTDVLLSVAGAQAYAVDYVLGRPVRVGVSYVRDEFQEAMLGVDIQGRVLATRWEEAAPGVFTDRLVREAQGGNEPTMAGALAAGVGTAVELFADLGTVTGGVDIAIDAVKAINAARAAGRARHAEAILAALGEYERAKQSADRVAALESIRRAMKADSDAAAAQRAISGETKLSTEGTEALSREGASQGVGAAHSTEQKVPEGSAGDPVAVKPESTVSGGNSSTPKGEVEPPGGPRQSGTETPPDTKAGVGKGEPCPPCPPSGKASGGSYKSLRTVYKGQGETTEIHHIPANSASDLAKGDGPAIAMDAADHAETASWGNSRPAQEFKATQAKLIEAGKFREAMELDISDIRSKFGSKYDEAISEAVDYAKSIGRW